jgi:hypothetical protein
LANNFDDLLRRDFRWPTPGDRLFQAAANPDANAYVEKQPRQRLFLMTEGYKKAADTLVDEACKDRFERDCLVYPIIFCYRHYIELSLKDLIASFGHTVGIQPNWNTHDLVMLWQTLQEIFRGYGIGDPEDVDPVVAEIMAEFSKVDPDSFSHRYPVDRRGKALPSGIESLDVRQLKDVMEALSGYFSGCDGYLSDLQQAGP